MKNKFGFAMDNAKTGQSPAMEYVMDGCHIQVRKV